MNFRITLEAMRFYKVKHERTIQVWFIILFAIQASLSLLPARFSDFTSLTESISQMAAGELILPALTVDNWIFLGLALCVDWIGLYFMLLYAALFVGEQSGLKPREIMLTGLRRLPVLILFTLLMIAPFILSMFLAMVPMIIFLAMMYFMPLDLILNRSSLAGSMSHSYEQTKGMKLMIVVQVFFLTIILSLPDTLLSGLLSGLPFAAFLAQTFFSVLGVFMQGRLMGIFYLYLVKKVPVVIPSIPKDL